MAPYTAEGIAQVDEGKEVAKQRLYELVGIVVHSGQASAGHYYSFVKEKRFVLETLHSSCGLDMCDTIVLEITNALVESLLYSVITNVPLVRDCSCIPSASTYHIVQS